MADPLPHRFQPRRELGNTGFHVTRLGIGDLADRNEPRETCLATLQRAMDYGLNVIDTAPGYEDGYSEELVGAALRGRRAAMFLIDKVDFLHEPVEPQVDTSLLRLGLDVVDLFVFHGLSTLEDWRLVAGPGGGLDQLDRCITAGKTRFKGLSSHDPEVLRRAIDSGRCDVVMFAVGPFVDARYVDEILPLAHARQVGSVCFKTFGAGKLLGDTSGYNQPLTVRPRGKLGSAGRDTGEPVLPHMSVRECVHYTLTCDPDVALLGMSHANELDAAVEAAAGFAPLSAAEMAALRSRAAEAVAGKGVCHWNPAA